MALTLAEAAQRTGLNRSTILRSIKAGRISGTRDELGVWQVEAVELFRVFKPVADVQGEPRAVPQHAQPDAELQVRIAVAEERLGELRQALADMRAQGDSWQAQAERLAIAAQARPGSAPSRGTAQARPWWRRAFG